MEYIQYIIINTELKMSTGKIAAQVAHASQMFIRNFLLRTGQVLDDNIIRNWYATDYKKIVLKVTSEAQLENLIKKITEAGFEEDVDFFRVYDLGYTEIEKNSFTAIGFTPMVKERVYPFIKRLRLL